MTVTIDATDAPGTEEMRVVSWEEEQLRGLGVPADDAYELARQPDAWHKAKRLLDAGCPVELVRSILA